MTGWIWEYQALIARRLLTWGIISAGLGLIFLLNNDPFWKALGIQFLAWGTIDAIIAGFALKSTEKDRFSQTGREIEEASIQRLKKLLWINSGLDVIYILSGIAILFILGKQSEAWKGHAWGIIIQGSFLLLFDSLHALAIPGLTGPFPIPSDLKPFDAPEHLPFLFEGGTPAALLVHGFPGTPADLRPIGKLMNEHGWTVKGLLLPGFGSNIRELGARRFEDWREAILSSVSELRKNHSPILLVGYSMGAAVLISTTPVSPPDGLVLLAPFIWKDSLIQRFLITIFLLILPPCVRVFKFADFSNQRMRDSIQRLFPNADLDNPATQAAIRQICMPPRILGEVRRAGIQAREIVPSISLPSLVIQGSQDKTVRPKRTLWIVKNMRKKPEYLEIDAGHDIVTPQIPAWAEISKSVIDFAEIIKQKHREIDRNNEHQ